MNNKDWVQPKTCQVGQVYYLKIQGNGAVENYRTVQFLAYRPCAAEVLVKDGGKARVICRVDLYQKGKGAGNGKLLP